MIGTAANEQKSFTVLSTVSEWCDKMTYDSQ